MFYYMGLWACCDRNVFPAAKINIWAIQVAAWFSDRFSVSAAKSVRFFRQIPKCEHTILLTKQTQLWLVHTVKKFL